MKNLKIAWRRLKRDRIASVMSVLSLTVGITCALMVFVIVEDRYRTRDEFHNNADQIYWLYRTSEMAQNEWERQHASFRAHAGPLLADELRELATVCRYRLSYLTYLYGDDLFRRDQAAYVDPAFLSLFSFPVLYGNPEALSHPQNIFISRTLAEKLSRDRAIADIVGTSLTLVRNNVREHFTISGIVETLSDHSSLQFDMLIPYQHLTPRAESDPRGEFEAMLFLHLKKNITPDYIKNRLPYFSDAYFAKQIDNYRAEGQWTKEASPFHVHLQPLSALSKFEMSGLQVRNMRQHFLVLLSLVGLLVLIVGAINFGIVTIGRLMTRGTEVGIRKTLGATRRHIIGQTILESLILCFLAMGLALSANELLLPHFASLFPFPHYNPQFQGNITGFLFILVLPVLLSILAGFYPSWLLSRLQPVNALKSETFPGQRARLSRFLLIVQFAVAVFLLASSTIMVQITDHFASMDRGFDMRHLMVIQPKVPGGEAEVYYERFRQKAEQLPGVVGLAAVNNIPVLWSAGMQKLTNSETIIWHYKVRGDFLKTLGIDLVSGKNLDPNGPINEVLVNEHFAKQFGWTHAPGQTFPFQVGQVEHPQVVGVVPDFYFQNILPPMGPLVIHKDPETAIRAILVRLQPDMAMETETRLKHLWSEVAPGITPQFGLLQDDLVNSIRDPRKMYQSIGYTASLMAIIVACVGLIGLAMHMLSRRTKEVGVRKVLGASAHALFVLLSLPIVRLAVIGCIIGTSMSFFAMRAYLQRFPFQTPLEPMHFAGPAIGCIVLALVAISYHTTRIVRTDPVKELRDE
ncbi:MAG: FtsX-like permease family protein [Gemmatimonadetes bacterium]|nr:FtsX-like permease family protein [Gemmatimonadota bacterium]